MRTVLDTAKKLSIPTEAEEKKVNELIKEISLKINNQLKKLKISAKLIVGGSIAKGTWLPGISDIDFFP